MSKKLLYFTAKWCGPCQQIKPFFYELEKKYTDISFSAIDVEMNPSFAERYNIKSLPTFIALDDNNQEVKRFSKADPNKLVSLVEELNAL